MENAKLVRRDPALDDVPPTLLRVCMDAIRLASEQGRKVSVEDMRAAAEREREARRG